MTRKKVSWNLFDYERRVKLSHLLDKIKGFFSTFVGGDLTRGFADLDLDGDGDGAPARKGLKYMDQMVR